MNRHRDRKNDLEISLRRRFLEGGHTWGTPHLAGYGEPAGRGVVPAAPGAGDTEAAVAALEEVLDAEPHHATALYLMGMA